MLILPLFAIHAIAAGSSNQAASTDSNTIQHVLLISVDGLHQSDLEWYATNHPNSELAQMVNGGMEFTNAHTSNPSDSSRRLRADDGRWPGSDRRLLRQ
jgi:predicted AlkP superfamily pyrophosphatase or phosphodiesterase